jgi:hypothetical protein
LAAQATPAALNHPSKQPIHKHIRLFTSSVLLGQLASEQSMPFAKAIPETYGAADQAAGFVWRAPPTEFIFDDTGRPKQVAYAALPRSKRIKTE